MLGGMLPTSARLLKLLSLLQAHREWSGGDLATRLEVDVRTVRRDVAKLRALGYPVHAAPGVAGGYQLGAGAKMPPLLLDDEEAVAVALGLRTAAGGSITGIEESSVRALAKLEQVLPSRLRRRVNTLQAVTMSTARSDTPVDATHLTVIATAARDRQRLRFEYRSHDGTASVRNVEPHRLVHTGYRWYLMAWDVDRQDWRNFRVDRMIPRTQTGPGFDARDVPEFDIGDFDAWRNARFQARIALAAPAQEIAARVPQRWGAVEAVDDRGCVLHTGADRLEDLLTWLLYLDVDFVIHEPAELRDHVSAVRDRMDRAVRH
ncbi:YafY family protein [Stackebrandtia albiflava]